MNIRTLIVDDQAPARALIKQYLKLHPDVEIIGEAVDGLDAFRLVRELQPDLMILDIQMPKLTGFELLELLDNPPLVIISTAFDNYAIKAFEKNACDYLMKPFLRERLESAIEKVRQRMSGASASADNLNKPSQSVHSLKDYDYLYRIAVRVGQRIRIIPVNDILYIESYGDYVYIHTVEGRFLKEKTMKYFESYLDDRQFIRIHRSYIVNVDQIKGLEMYVKDNWTVLLSNKETIKVSASGYKALKRVLNF